MKFSVKTLPLFGLLSICFCFACNDDSAAREAQLMGHWKITEAIRSERATTTMDGMFFEFKPEGEMVTNITGEDETYRYELTDEQILQREGTIEADYLIESLLDSQLIVTTTLGGKPFRITLAK